MDNSITKDARLSAPLILAFANQDMITKEIMRLQETIDKAKNDKYLLPCIWYKLYDLLRINNELGENLSRLENMELNILKEI